MEKLKGKHNHTLTNILKVFTFAIVLLFPFLVFMPTALYYGFNEHAQIEIPQKVGIYQTNEVNNVNDLNANYVYHFDNLYLEINNEGLDYITFNILKLENTTPVLNSYQLDNSNITINNYDSSNNNILRIYYGDDEGIFFHLTNKQGYAEITFDDTELTINNLEFYIDTGEIENFKQFCTNRNIIPTKSDYQQYELSETTTISENLSNSWENMWETPLFAWTNNTPFTATTNAFASVFNISHQSGFYNLVAYFITITAIYLVIDIVIGVATMLTHMIAKQD